MFYFFFSQTSWISASRQANSALFFFKTRVIITMSAFPLWYAYAPAVPRELGTTQIWGGHAKKNLRRFAPEFLPPTSKSCRRLCQRPQSSDDIPVRWWFVLMVETLSIVSLNSVKLVCCKLFFLSRLCLRRSRRYWRFWVVHFPAAQQRIVNCNNRTVLFHFTSLFLNILLETAWRYDLLLNSYSALKFVQFFSGPPCIHRLNASQHYLVLRSWAVNVTLQTFKTTFCKVVADATTLHPILLTHWAAALSQLADSRDLRNRFFNFDSVSVRFLKKNSDSVRIVIYYWCRLIVE